MNETILGNAYTVLNLETATTDFALTSELVIHSLYSHNLTFKLVTLTVKSKRVESFCSAPAFFVKNARSVLNTWKARI